MNENSIRPHYPQSISDGQHSIYIAELPIRLYQSRSGAAVQTVYRHILIAGFDEHGRQMWEMNGLATDAKTRQTRTFGAPFDSSDRIWFWQHIPTRFWNNAQNPVRLFNGSPKEISRLRLQAMEAGTKINEADLHYRAWLNPQNSNSVAATLLKAMGKDPKDVLLGMRELYENGTFSGGFPITKGLGSICCQDMSHLRQSIQLRFLFRYRGPSTLDLKMYQCPNLDQKTVTNNI